MAADIGAFDATTGKRVRVPRRWIDNPAIYHGRYVSETPKPKPKPKSSRAKRESVETKAASEAADATDNAPATGDSTEES